MKIINNKPNHVASRALNMASANRHRHSRQPVAAMADNRGSTAQLRQMQQQLDNSAVMTLQRRQLESCFGRPIQKVEAMEEEELLQGKSESMQRQGALEDEALLQGRFAAIQCVEEEELLQGKFETVQRQADLEEEELLQGKYETRQRQPLSDEEAPLPAHRNGLPDSLRTGIESLSGMDMSDVRVHRNSNKPAQVNALAYAQGNDIHLGPGQDKHLPHEAWHVVQQRQGRVEPTLQVAGKMINDDVALEAEADVMGDKALQHKKI